MKNKYVTDTMGLVLRLEKRKLPIRVREIFEMAECGQSRIVIPSIAFAEIGYLSERKKIEASLLDVSQYIKRYPCIFEQCLSLEIVVNAFNIKDIPELHDRLIASVSFTENLELLSNDPEILKSKFVKTIWN